MYIDYINIFNDCNTCSNSLNLIKKENEHKKRKNFYNSISKEIANRVFFYYCIEFYLNEISP